MIGSAERQTFGQNSKTILCFFSWISEPCSIRQNTYLVVILLVPANVAFHYENERVETGISLLAAFNPIGHFTFVAFCVVS